MFNLFPSVAKQNMARLHPILRLPSSILGFSFGTFTLKTTQAVIAKMFLARIHFHGFHSYGGGYYSYNQHPWITLCMLAVMIAVVVFSSKSSE